MESIDQAIESVFQSLLQIEEVTEQTREHLGLDAPDGQGVPEAPTVTRIDSRIQRLSGINGRLQDVHSSLASILNELGKI